MDETERDRKKEGRGVGGVEGVREGERMRLIWHMTFTRPFHHGEGKKERGSDAWLDRYRDC